MEKQVNSLDALFEKTSDYLETRGELLKLRAVNTASEVASTMISRFIIIAVVSLMLLLLNAGIAIWIGEMMGKVYYGFFLVGGFYMLLAIILYVSRHKLLKKPVQDKLVDKLLN
jgi:hypothetical protein